jgi:hypothetical protein
VRNDDEQELAAGEAGVLKDVIYILCTIGFFVVGIL